MSVLVRYLLTKAFVNWSWKSSRTSIAVAIVVASIIVHFNVINKQVYHVRKGGVRSGSSEFCMVWAPMPPEVALFERTPWCLRHTHRARITDLGFMEVLHAVDQVPHGSSIGRINTTYRTNFHTVAQWTRLFWKLLNVSSHTHRGFCICFFACW